MACTMWTFETANFRIVATIEPSIDLDLSWDEDGGTARGLHDGSLEAFDTKVAVYHKGTGQELGADYLGESIYKEPRDFFTEHYGCKSKGYGSYFPDMVREAIREARATLRKMKEIRVRG